MSRKSSREQTHLRSGNSRPRVAFLTPKYPPIPSGFGDQAYAVNSILSQRAQMTLLTYGHPPRPIESVHKTIRNLPQQPRDYSVGQLMLWIINSVLWLIRNRKQYDLIHTLSGYYWSIPFVLVGKLLRKPTVVKITSTEIDPTIGNGASRRLRIRLLRLATCIVVLTEHGKTVARAAGFRNDRVRRIPNAVDVSRYAVGRAERARLRRDMGISEDCFVVLAVGQIGRRKGTDRLLLAWDKFVRTNRSSRLLLVGAEDGSLKEHELHEIEGVQLVGHVNDPASYYAVADCFVLLSRSEGLANVLLEAIAAGVPVIVSGIPSNQELAQLFGGTVVGGDDIEIANAVAKQLRIIAAARSASGNSDAHAQLLEHFSLDSVARQYEQLYMDLLQV